MSNKEYDDEDLNHFTPFTHEFNEIINKDLLTRQYVVFKGDRHYFWRDNMTDKDKIDKDSFPEGYTFMGSTFFTECHNLKQIPPNTIFKKTVAFRDCSSLEKISEGVVFEDDVLFYNCENIKDIPDNVVFNGSVEFTTSRHFVLRKKDNNDNGSWIEGRILEQSVSEEMKTSLVKMKQDGRIKGNLYI